MTQFHALAIKDIRRETADCVSIAFSVPPELATAYRFQAGQNVTLKLNVDGEEIRRSYSICSSPFDNELRVAIKKLPEGKFSGYAHLRLQPGDLLEVLPPSGRFSLQPDPTRTARYLAFAAGSGITPVISIIKTLLATEPHSHFTLVYGNRNRGSIIFRENLDALKNRYMDRFTIHHVLSREQTDAPVNEGRIDAAKCEQLARYLLDIHSMDHIFICGPESMIFSTRDWLYEKGIGKEKIHFELFTVPGEAARAGIETFAENSGQTSKIKLKLDGITFEYDLASSGLSILDGALRQGADLPYACKGGVCATCRAKLVSGQVDMDNNYALEDEEVRQGYILTCQSHPRSPVVEVDFDSR